MGIVGSLNHNWLRGLIDFFDVNLLMQRTIVALSKNLTLIILTLIILIECRFVRILFNFNYLLTGIYLLSVLNPIYLSPYPYSIQITSFSNNHSEIEKHISFNICHIYSFINIHKNIPWIRRNLHFYMIFLSQKIRKTLLNFVLFYISW